MRARLRHAAPVLVALWALAPPGARADVISRAGRVESISPPNLFSLKSRNALGLDATIVLRYDAARFGDRIVAGREVLVDYEEATRTISAASDPAEAEPARARMRRIDSPGDAPPETRKGEAGETWALLIGIENYERLDVLKYPSEDVDTLEKVYRTHGGVDPSRILKITDGSGNRPTASALPSQIRAFLRRPRKGDRLVVFFSGHGLLDEATGAGYLAASDCDPSRGETIARTAVAIDDLLAWMGQSGASQKILMLDACHSGAFDGRKLRKTLGDAQGVVTLASCGNDQGSIEDDATRHGMFTNWLVEALSGAADADLDGRITSLELAHWLDKASSGQTKQNPTHNHPPNIGQPVALTLHGVARTLTEAERLGIDGRYADAMIRLQDMPPCDDLAMEFRRRELLERFSKGSYSLFLERGEAEVAGLSDEALANPFHRARAIAANLMLAKSRLKSGDHEEARLKGFRARVEKARALVQGVSYQPLRVDALLALAETMQLEEEYAKAPKDRVAAQAAVDGLLLNAYHDVVRAPGQDWITQVAKVAGAARRMNRKEVYKQCTDWVVNVDAYGRSYDTIQRSRVLGLAQAEGGDVAGAIQAMMTHDEALGGNGRTWDQAAFQATVARAAVDTGEMTNFRVARERAEASIRADAPSYANTAPAVLGLATAFARAGEIETAETWLARLPNARNEAGIALAEIAIARVRDARFDEARKLLDRVPWNPDRLEACRLLAQAEMIASPESTGQLIAWIKTLADPLDRAAAYAGIVDGLEKKPWNRLAMAYTDDYRRDLLIRSGIAGRGGAAPNASNSVAFAGYERPSYGGRAAVAERSAPALGSILNDVDRGFAIASMVQSFSHHNVSGGVGTAVSLVAPPFIPQVQQMRTQVTQPYENLRSGLGPFGGYLPSVPRLGFLGL